MKILVSYLSHCLSVCVCIWQYGNSGMVGVKFGTEVLGKFSVSVSNWQYGNIGVVGVQIGTSVLVSLVIEAGRDSTVKLDSRLCRKLQRCCRVLVVVSGTDSTVKFGWWMCKLVQLVLWRMVWFEMWCEQLNTWSVGQPEMFDCMEKSAGKYGRSDSLSVEFYLNIVSSLDVLLKHTGMLPICVIVDNTKRKYTPFNLPFSLCNKCMIKVRYLQQNLPSNCQLYFQFIYLHACSFILIFHMHLTFLSNQNSKLSSHSVILVIFPKQLYTCAAIPNPHFDHIVCL
jgi:hypothetical protein